MFRQSGLGNPSSPPTTHHNETDFQRVKDMKMNAIRFYMNYGLFENDSSPYSYKQSGWNWLNQKYSMGKKVRNIFNLEYALSSRRIPIERRRNGFMGYSGESNRLSHYGRL